jgi:hypothetical protein
LAARGKKITAIRYNLHSEYATVLCWTRSSNTQPSGKVWFSAGSTLEGYGVEKQFFGRRCQNQFRSFKEFLYVGVEIFLLTWLVGSGHLLAGQSSPSYGRAILVGNRQVDRKSGPASGPYSPQVVLTKTRRGLSDNLENELEPIGIRPSRRPGKNTENTVATDPHRTVLNRPGHQR